MEAGSGRSGWRARIVRRGCPDDWLRCAAEWGAALVLLRGIRRWLERLTGRTEWGGGRASKVGRMWGLAISKCPDVRAARRKQQNKEARLAREARTRQVEKDAARFQMLMGVEGDGHITLAPGLEDVDVTFRRRRRVNWRPAGKRNRKGRRRRRAADGEGDASDGDGDSTVTQRRRATTRRATTRAMTGRAAPALPSRRERATMATAAWVTRLGWQ